MKVGSLFSGVGGFDLGLERAGYEIIWQVEIDEFAKQILRKHWPNIPCYGDITAVNWEAVEPVDTLCGGFPCQDLSYAGNRAGIDGKRSGLWSEYVRAIRALRPRYIIVENVPGLLTNAYLGRVLGDLASCGYDAEWDCIPGYYVGSPQIRDRVWIVAYSPEGRTDKHPGRSVLRREQLSQQSRGMLRWPSYSSIRRGINGIPNAVDRVGALGNAVIPQIAEAIGRMILDVERGQGRRDE